MFTDPSNYSVRASEARRNVIDRQSSPLDMDIDPLAEPVDSLFNADMMRAAESKRKLLDKQLNSYEMRSQLCNNINKIKGARPDIVEKVQNLKTQDPDLYEYIKSLEIINSGIWCDKCTEVKSIDASNKICAQPHITKEIINNEIWEQVNVLKREIDSTIYQFTKQVNHIYENVTNAEEVIKKMCLQYTLQ